MTDGRGNTTTTRTDLLGRTVCVTNATGATTSYDVVHDQPSVITDAMGNTSCYRYDQRGRKAAEWGMGVQSSVCTYVDADRLVLLEYHGFRNVTLISQLKRDFILEKEKGHRHVGE